MVLKVVFLVALLFAVCCAQGNAPNNQRTYPGQGDFEGFNIVLPRTYNAINDIDAREYEDWEIVPEVGVSKECLVQMDNIAWMVNMNMARSLCPKNTFGALVVDFADHTGAVHDSFGRSCGRILSTNRGVKTTTDVTEHSENDAMRRLAYHHPGQRSNTTLWNAVAVFTPGASCPMDTAAEIWAGVAWQIYSLSIADLIALNFSQIAVEPEELLTRVGTSTNQHPGLIRYVNRPVNVARFAFKNIISNPCLPGCHRVTPTSICTDIVPYLLEPSKLIPDVNYYQVPDDFELIINPALAV